MGNSDDNKSHRLSTISQDTSSSLLSEDSLTSASETVVPTSPSVAHSKCDWPSKSSSSKDDYESRKPYNGKVDEDDDDEDDDAQTIIANTDQLEDSKSKRSSSHSKPWTDFTTAEPHPLINWQAGARDPEAQESIERWNFFGQPNRDVNALEKNKTFIFYTASSVLLSIAILGLCSFAFAKGAGRATTSLVCCTLDAVATLLQHGTLLYGICFYDLSSRAENLFFLCALSGWVLLYGFFWGWWWAVNVVMTLPLPFLSLNEIAQTRWLYVTLAMVVIAQGSIYGLHFFKCKKEMIRKGYVPEHPIPSDD